jgi:hypothetical protein
MRPLVLLLLLVNLITLAFSQLPRAGVQRVQDTLTQRELHADKVAISDSASVRPAQTIQPEVKQEVRTVYLAARSEPVPVCMQWAGIAAQDANRSRTLLDSLGVAYRIPDDDQATELYWVSIPGLQTLSAVDSLTARLRADGQRNLAVTRKSAEGIYAISLGVFRSEESAKRLQERFLRLGAVVTPYGTSSTTYIVQASSAIADQIAAAASEFDQTTVKVVDCPEIRAG